MVDASVKLLDDDVLVLRRTGVRFPIELRPAGFDPANPSAWPAVEGRLEWVEGRLLYMPPCAEVQQYVAVDAAHLLRTWSETHPEFLVGGNEAGMHLGADIRAADVAVWHRASVGRPTGRLHRAAPLLAVEVAGQDEDETALREKANWYLNHGVGIVWIVLPEQREVLVMQASGESRHSRRQHLPGATQLPGLAPAVDQFFVQLDGL